VLEFLEARRILEAASAPAEQEATGWADGKPSDVACAGFRLSNDGD
jgi:hypothetical protein